MKAKKSLGQNFLQSIPAAKAMVSAGEVRSDDTILEIGPGKGMITKLLLETVANIVAVEKDVDLIDVLTEKFHNEITDDQLNLIHDDILLFDEGNLPKNYKVVANIPYYITGAILEKFLASKNKPSSITLLVQKEIADRIMARDGKESILSLSVKVYGEPSYIKKVGKNNFKPSPKVDSAIISIKNISGKRFNNSEEEKLFFKLVKEGFAHKRKKLINNLSSVSREKLTTSFNNLGLDENTRAEELSMNDWLTLINHISK